MMGAFQGRIEATGPPWKVWATRLYRPSFVLLSSLYLFSS